MKSKILKAYFRNVYPRTWFKSYSSLTGSCLILKSRPITVCKANISRSIGYCNRNDGGSKNAQLKMQWKRKFSDHVASKDSFTEDLFNILRGDQDKLSLTKFIESLKAVGLSWKEDPRLAETATKLEELQHEGGPKTLLDHENFARLIQPNLLLLRRAFNNEFVIPDFQAFCNQIHEIYWKIRPNTNGEVASYIPQLSRYNSEFWGISLCTIDGQRYSIGDTNISFSLQSVSKPLTYALAIDELGSDVVHHYVGLEPSGQEFNKITLLADSKPHNPMINAGAILTASLIRSNLTLPDRFDYAHQHFKKLAGGEFIGFNNAVFLSERETADRNFALGHYLKENKCFPEGTNLLEVMDFYFQLCAIELNCQSSAVIGATLANGGICPITREKVISPEAVRNALTLMHSCGMYDYSGEFAFKVGLPAKSGVSGSILLVVPNVMGMCLWSPPLDSYGNSARGIEFCKDLVEQFSFHFFDNLVHSRAKKDPRKRNIDNSSPEVTSLIFSAYNGDLSTLKSLALSGVNMGMCDYDSRTALHLAAAEGHFDCVKFLIYNCNVNLEAKDRWNRSAYDDAAASNSPHKQAILDYISNVRKNKAKGKNLDENSSSHNNTDSRVFQNSKDTVLKDLKSGDDNLRPEEEKGNDVHEKDSPKDLKKND